MTVLITLTVAGADSGPFNLFSNLDGYTSAFAVGISKAALLAGYSSSVVPDGTTIVRVVSIGDCTNYIDIVLSSLITTTTTTIAPTTTTTTSGVLCNSYEMIGVSDGPGCMGFVNYTYTDCLGVVLTGGSFSSSSSETVCGQSTPIITCGSATINDLGPCLP